MPGVTESVIMKAGVRSGTDLPRLAGKKGKEPGPCPVGGEMVYPTASGVRDAGCVGAGRLALTRK